MMGQHPYQNDRRNPPTELVEQAHNSFVGLRALQRQVEEVNAEWSTDRKKKTRYSMSNRGERAHRHLDLREIEEYWSSAFHFMPYPNIGERMTPEALSCA